MRTLGGRSGGRALAVALATLAVSGMAVIAPGADGPVVEPPGSAKRVLLRPAPEVPGEVVAAMQGGKYAEAATALDKLIAGAKGPGDRSYYRFLRGIAERLGGKSAEGRTTLAEALREDPKGPWASKIRFELATAELAAGRPAAAEALARAEAESLLASDRKDRLAEVYHAFARRLLAPDNPLTRPDPASAVALLARARDLAKGETLRASLLFEMARAAQVRPARPNEQTKSAAPNEAVAQVGDAIRDFGTYIREYPRGADRFAARFHLAEAQLAAGQVAVARLTWTDLARDLAKGLAKVPSKDQSDLRGSALYQISRTYGIPNPGDDLALNLGVAALRRFLADAPAHPKAVRASFEVGASYLARGKADPAIEALTAFLKGGDYRAETDEARRDLADLPMTATFLIARTWQGQGRFDEAIRGYQGYLAKFPNGPQSAAAQRAILDARLGVAADALARKKYDEARAAWAAYVAGNPLDARVPQLLFEVGSSFAAEKKWDEAIAAWDTLIGKFVGSEPAGHAQFEAASILEREKGDPVGAIERFRKIAVAPWNGQASQRVAVMEAKALAVVSPRAFRSGETAQLKVTTRNLETLTFSAYKLNPEAYFRKKHALGGVGALDIGLVAPDAEWTAPVPGYARFRPVEATYDLKVAVPGIYVVKVSDEKTLESTALVVGSDLDAIVKLSREQVLVFAQDMKTGKGRKGARVLIADGSGIILEKTTGDDGVLLAGLDKPSGLNPAGLPNMPPQSQPADFHYLVLDGADASGSGLAAPGMVGQGLSARAYLDTDRPAYRPGQEVAIRGIIREAKDGQYENPAGQNYKLEVHDARGRLLIAKGVALSPFGTFHQAVRLDPSAPVGAYRIRLFKPGGSDFSGNFQVQSYKLEKLGLDFDLPKTIYFRGETVQGAVVARYQYGSPASARPIEVALPDGRTVRGLTDAAGKFAFEFPTDGFAEEQGLTLTARLPGDDVQAGALLYVTVRGFGIKLATPREVYLDGETFSLALTTADPLGKPTGRDLKVSVLENVELVIHGPLSEREVFQATVTTDKATGKASLPLKIDSERGHPFTIRATGLDQFGNPVVAERSITVSGKDDGQRLRIFTDRSTFSVGEPATVRVHSRSRPGPALLTWEADRILRYRIAPLAEGENPLTWDVDGAQFPNFTLTASKMSEGRFDEARLDVRVERDLRVALKPAKESVAPGEEVVVEVTTVDQLGKPVAAEVALALVDRSLLRQFLDQAPPIGPFFHGQTRTGSFVTRSSNPFRDEPPTRPVSTDVVEEAERQLAQATNELGKRKAGDAAKSQLDMGFRSDLARGQSVAKSEPGQQDPFDSPEALTPAPMGGAKAESKSASTNWAAHGMAGGGGGMGGMGGGTGRLTDGFGFDVNSAPEEEARAGRIEFDAAGPRSFADIPGSRVRALGYLGAGAAQFGKDDRASAREQFTETAYWNPSVVTDASGKATVRFKAPSSLSEYRFSAKGVTGSDTLVGQATAALAVRKDFFVVLKAPAALTEGDRPRFSAQVHHSGGLAGSVGLSLLAYAGDREQVFPKAIEIKGDGVDEVTFDPFEVPGGGDTVRLTLGAKLGDRSDEVVVEVPVRPWGVRATASASGTSSDDETVLIALPEGRTYEDAELRIDLAPTVRRLLVELALGHDSIAFGPHAKRAPVVPPSTMIDRASELIAAASALAYLREVRATEAPEAARLADRVRSLAAELVTTQNDDGGWPWIAPVGDQPRGNSDRMTSARAGLAIEAARSVGLLAEPSAADKSVAYLTGEFLRAGGDQEGRASILYSLAKLGRASFEQANALNRSRGSLNNVSLAYLSLALSALDRPTMADEVLGLLAARAKREAVGPGQKARVYWEGSNQGPWHRGAAETTALACLAFTAARPQAEEVDGAARWLLAHRSGNGWSPEKARGPAVAALAAYHGKAKEAGDRYRLVVSVGGVEVGRVEVDGQGENRTIVVPRKLFKPGTANPVRFAIEGRGTYGYSVTMTGFVGDFGFLQARKDKPFAVAGRAYLAADPELDGKTLPTGFSRVVNAVPFTNKVGQVAQGGRARVRIDLESRPQAGQSPWERDFLVVQETLPAGSTLIEGSIRSTAASHTLADGILTFFHGPDNDLGPIEYEVAGYLPGQYRALPTEVRSAYDPGRSHLGPVGDLQVLSPGEPSTDPYRPTPDELYARGLALFQLDRLAEAAAPLEALFGGYAPRDEVARDAARMLLTIHIKDYQARKVVADFEVLKEKGPDLVIPFDEILVVGRAYRDIGEPERAYLIFRAVAEASYLEDAQVGEVLRQNGKTLGSLAYLIDLWRESPGSASIQGDFLALAQSLAAAAGRGLTDPALRAELAEAGITRSELRLQAIRIIQVLLAESPRNPLADEASLSLVTNFLELDDFDSAVKLAPRYAQLYPRSKFLDSFQYADALGRFELGQYDRAIEVAQAIAKASYKDADGVAQPSANKWEALYILGQIHDARRQPAKAVEFYNQVADRFADAAGAVKSLTRKALTLPEVSILTPNAPPRAAGQPKPLHPDKVELASRNVAEADLKVYPVDLMRLYLSRRNLDGIAGIDLAGITPLHESTVKLGDGAPFTDKVETLNLPLPKEGAYLVMARGQDLYASGIVLVTPLELEVLEEPEAGRVRVTVRDAATKDPVPKVQVKVIGSDNPAFFTGQTDLRGVFVAEGVSGQVTAVARAGASRYAFYRGETTIGSRPPIARAPSPTETEPSAAKPGMMGQGQSLIENLQKLDASNAAEGANRLQNRINPGRKGIRAEEAR